MVRLVVKVAGRRVSGWAYASGGDPNRFFVELTRDGEVLDRQRADLSLAEWAPFLSSDEQLGHGFEFFLDPRLLLPSRSILWIEVVGAGVRRCVEFPAGRRMGGILELYVDNITAHGFLGWGWDPEFPERSAIVTLTAPANRKGELPFSREIIANRFRSDVAPLGLANGNCGFDVKWPKDLPILSRKKALLRLRHRVVDLGAKYERFHAQSRVDE